MSASRAILALLISILGITSLVANAFAETSSTLRPIADGSLDSGNWTTVSGIACSGANCFSEIDEAAGSACTSSDGDTSYIYSTTQNAPQTFDISLAAIPDNATITDITVTTCHVKGQSGQANKFQSRYCVDGTCTDSGNDITPAATYHETSQNFSDISVIKTSATDFEIGVVITNNANKQVRVSQLAVVLTYTVASDSEDEEQGSGNNNQGKSDEPHGKKHAGQGPLYSPDGATDEAPAKLEQSHGGKQSTGSATNIVTATAGQTLIVTTRPVDFDQAKGVHLRMAGRVYQLKDRNKDGLYELPLQLPATKGSVPYSLTVDYGITTRTEYGTFILGVKQQPTSFINRLFQMVYSRDPSSTEQEHWVYRFRTGNKKKVPEIFGAMQWQAKFGQNEN